MFYCKIDVLLQEVPGEVSLAFYIAGCSLRCKGCHSSLLFKEENGAFLTQEFYKSLLYKYKGYATCVLFMGGEWRATSLLFKLRLAKELGYKTCLYTGEDFVSDEILDQLDWVKTGRWVAALGGLDNKQTNQIFKEVKTGKVLNVLFQNK